MEKSRAVAMEFWLTLRSSRVKVPTQPDGGEELAKHKGIPVRVCLKEVRSKHTSRWTRTR
jgi:hypothetical protein